MADQPTADWRARLLATLQTQLDPQTRAMLDVFAHQLRVVVRKYIARGVSVALIRVMAAPAVSLAYAQLLYKLQIPYQPPEPAFVEKLIDDLIDEVRARRAS